MKTLFVSDLDGTLLTKEERVSDYSREHINALLARGLDFTLIDIRIGVLSEALHALCGDSTFICLPFIQRGLIYDRSAGKTHHYSCFEDSLKIICIVRSCNFGIMPFVYSAEERRENVAWLQGRETFGDEAVSGAQAGDPRLRATFSEGRNC